MRIINEHINKMKKYMYIIFFSLLLTGCNRKEHKNIPLHTKAFCFLYDDNHIMISERNEEGFVIRTDTLYPCNSGFCLTDEKGSVLLLSNDNDTIVYGVYKGQKLCVEISGNRSAVYRFLNGKKEIKETIIYDRNYRINEIKRFEKRKIKNEL